MLYTEKMNELRQELLDLIKIYPKHFSKMVQKDPMLSSAIASCYGATTSEKVYNFLWPDQYLCNQGNIKKFKSVNDGYSFCGRTGECACAKQAVSLKVSATKQNYSADKKAAISEKRERTNLIKYGCTNTGQTEKAKAAQKAVYDDQHRSASIVAQVKATKLDRYNNENFNNVEQIKSTFKQKYTVDYWSLKYSDKDLHTLQDADQLKELYQKHSVVEIADLLNVHIQTVYKYLNKHQLREPFKSSEETEIVVFLESLGITNIIRNSRKILPSKRELDIFLPDYNLAIEYNGVYWHHEDVDHITRSYHCDKFKECASQGIQLITIFSTFWKSKKEIVKSVLASKLGFCQTTAYARKCKVVTVDTATLKQFLNTTHIQGYTTSSYNYGLTFNDQIVAVMTFGRTRTGIGKSEDGFELIRFASKGRVVGGASKLLKHFISQHLPNKIISYSDNEWSTGNLYSTLGFTLETEIKPSYWYVAPREEKLMHRYNFAKHKLVEKGYDATQTEREITKQMGLLRVWDCGKKRWVLTLQ